MDEAAIVIHAMLRKVANWRRPDGLIHEVWPDSPTSACVVFEHTRGNLGLLGHRTFFPPHAIENDPMSTGEAWAFDLLEPLGALTYRIRRDQFGVGWVAGLDPNEHFPVPPTWRPKNYMDEDNDGRTKPPSRGQCL